MQRLDTIVSHLHDNDYVMIEKRGEVGILRMLVRDRHQPTSQYGTRDAEEDMCTPTGNVLCASMRRELLRGLRELEADPACTVIVLTSDSHTLFATGVVNSNDVEEDVGEDVKTIQPAAPSLRQLVIAVERCRKVVVALINGLCASSGLELALAAAYRVATRRARFAFPEVHLGLVPRAGGARRLARLVGVRGALFLLTTGCCVDAAEAQRLGLVDATVSLAAASPSSRASSAQRLPDETTAITSKTTPSAMMMVAVAARAVSAVNADSAQVTGEANEAVGGRGVVCDAGSEDVGKGVRDAGSSVWALVSRLGRVGHPASGLLTSKTHSHNKDVHVERGYDKTAAALDVTGTTLPLMTPCQPQMPLSPYGVPGSLWLPYYVSLIAWVRRQWRQNVPRNGPQGVLHAARAVELALHSVHEPGAAMAQDEALYRHCAAQPEAAALRHLLHATERLARRSATVAHTVTTHTRTISADSTQPPPLQDDVRHVVLVGADELSVQLALLLLLLCNAPSRAVRVTVVTLDTEKVTRVQQRVAHCMQQELRCPAAQCTQAMARLSVVADLMGRVADAPCTGVVQSADVVIECAEAAPLAARKRLLTQLDRMCDMATTIFLTTATNQCALHELAACTTRPSRVLGVHFYAPVLESALVEVITDTQNRAGVAGGAMTYAPDVLPRVMQLLRRVHKPAVVRSTAGRCVGLRLFLAGLYQACAMLEEGCYPLEVDRTLRHGGHFQLGVFELADAMGLTVLTHAAHGEECNGNTNTVKPGQPTRAVYDVADELVRAGHTGRSVGEGWYRYTPSSYNEGADTFDLHLGWRAWNAMLWNCGLVDVAGSEAGTLCPGLQAPYVKPRCNTDVEAMVRDCSTGKRIKRREVPASEVVERLVLAMVNEAALLLAEGAVAQASELDCLSVLGLGFPAFRGGLCYDADRRYDNANDTAINIMKKGNNFSLLLAMQLYHWSLGPNTFPTPCAAVLEMKRTGGTFASMFDQPVV